MPKKVSATIKACQPRIVNDTLACQLDFYVDESKQDLSLAIGIGDDLLSNLMKATHSTWAYELSGKQIVLDIDGDNITGIQGVAS